MSLAQKITEHLGGDWNGRYGLAPGVGHSKKDRSLKIAPHKYDADDVVVHSFAGDDVLDLKKAWRQTGLLPRCGQSYQASDPVKIVNAKLDAQKRDKDEAARKQQTARWLWETTKPAGGTIAETYLHSRGIMIDPLPSAIRFLPPSSKHPYPAMVVPFGIPDEPEPGVYHLPPERVTGIHITHLHPDGSGKAPIDPPRRMLGRIKGAPIALVPPGDGLGLAIAEGIESALAVHVGTGLGCWAAGAAGFMPALADVVPAFIECVTAVIESDPAGERGGKEFMRRLTARGVETMEWRAN